MALPTCLLFQKCLLLHSGQDITQHPQVHILLQLDLSMALIVPSPLIASQPFHMVWIIWAHLILIEFRIHMAVRDLDMVICLIGHHHQDHGVLRLMS